MWKKLAMDHLDEAQLYSLVFDSALLADEEQHHFRNCATCQQALQAIQLLASELAVAQRSAPSPAAQQRYASLFAQVQRQPSLLQQLWQGVRATLAWDSRQQPAFQGVRSAGATAYRLLYTTPQADIELMVEAGQRLRRVEGEVVAASDVTGDKAGDTASAASATPALVQLVAAGALHQEAETDAFGRFHLRDVAPGAYDLLFTLASGDLLAVSDLEIS